MRIEFHYEYADEKFTNFSIAEAIVELCGKDYNNEGLDAEVVAKMILLEVDARKGGKANA